MKRGEDGAAVKISAPLQGAKKFWEPQEFVSDQGSDGEGSCADFFGEIPRGLIHHAVRREMFDIVQQRQKNALEDDWRVGVIESYLEARTETCIIEVWHDALAMTEKPNARQSREIGAILDSLDGWERAEGKKRFGEYSSQRFWRKRVTAMLVPVDEEITEIVDIGE